MDADGDTPVETVTLVSAHVEVEVADPTTLGTVKHIIVGCIIEHLSIIISIKLEIQRIHIQIVRLAERLGPVRTGLILIAYHVATVVEIPIITTFPHIFEVSLMIRQHIQRRITQTVGCRKNLVEIVALVEVKAHIHERAAADTGRIDQTQLVETHLRTVLSAELLRVLLGDQSCRHTASIAPPIPT